MEIPKEMKYEKLINFLSEQLGEQIKDVEYWVNEKELRIKFENGN